MAVKPDTKRKLVTALLIGPAGLWLFLFLVLPFIAILVFSVGERGPAGGYQPAFTLSSLQISVREPPLLSTRWYWRPSALSPVCWSLILSPISLP